MVEFLLPFSLGYFACRIFQYLISSSAQTVVLENRTILKWDNSTFAWRPCPLSMVGKDKGEKYMVAAPLEGSVVRALREKMVEKS